MFSGRGLVGDGLSGSLTANRHDIYVKECASYNSYVCSIHAFVRRFLIRVTEFQLSRGPTARLRREPERC